MIFKYTNLQFARDYSFKWYSAWHLNYAPICFMNSNQIFKLLRNDLVIRMNIISIIEYVYQYISNYDEGWVFQISFNQMWVFKYCFCRVYYIYFQNLAQWILPPPSRCKGRKGWLLTAEIIVIYTVQKQYLNTHIWLKEIWNTQPSS